MEMPSGILNRSSKRVNPSKAHFSAMMLMSGALWSCRRADAPPIGAQGADQRCVLRSECSEFPCKP